MPELLAMLVAGVVQGILEWLPVSSEGFVAAALLYFGCSPRVSVDLALLAHGGTMAAAALYFRRELAQGLRSSSLRRGIVPFLASSTAFTAAAGLPLYRFVTSLDSRAMTALLGISLLATGLLARVRWVRGSKVVEDLTLLDGVVAGLAQGAAVIPGISRSGSTILALMLLGLPPSEAVKASFIMSIPASAGAVLLAWPADSLLPVAVMVACSLAAGLLSIGLISRAASSAPSAFPVALGVICLLSLLAPSPP
ncbi:MAG: undecaprenyl-diphosphate phosphatase [Thermoproteota archaeon]|nr:MAG: undecaprenyl-diphosphate phosphatase [Candidatus Korarchaeota archaeon]